MRKLTLYEVGIDPLPVDSSSILLFDKHTSFNMFDQHFAIEGTVQYMYGDIADSLDKAIEKGGIVSTNVQEINNIGNNDKIITIDIDSEKTLVDGCLWMYSHEYYSTIDENIFPFQTWEEYSVALKQEWIKLLKFKEGKACYIPKDSDLFLEEDKNIPIHYDKSKVLFNNKTFILTWERCNNNITLLNWKINT